MRDRENAVGTALGRPDAGAGPGLACRGLRCWKFESAPAALRHTLAAHPARILAVGEAHPQATQAGKSQERPPAVRFAEELLPVLQGRATDLVIELMTSPRCADDRETQVAQRQSEVTHRQSQSAQPSFVALGFSAKKLGIVPHALNPTCDDLARVLDAGLSDIDTMLRSIAALTAGRLETLDDARPASALLVAYGGAMHNDLEPRPGREPWSYGPRLSRRFGDRVVALDLVIPSAIGDTDVWRAQPWFAHYDRHQQGRSALLMETSVRSYVLFFPPDPARTSDTTVDPGDGR